MNVVVVRVDRQLTVLDHVSQVIERDEPQGRLVLGGEDQSLGHQLLDQVQLGLSRRTNPVAVSILQLPVSLLELFDQVDPLSDLSRLERYGLGPAEESTYGSCPETLESGLHHHTQWTLHYCGHVPALQFVGHAGVDLAEMLSPSSLDFGPSPQLLWCGFSHETIVIVMPKYYPVP